MNLINTIKPFWITWRCLNKKSVKRHKIIHLKTQKQRSDEKGVVGNEEFVFWRHKCQFSFVSDKIINISNNYYFLFYTFYLILENMSTNVR